MQNKSNQKNLTDSEEREVRVCIAVQKIGKGTNQEVFDKLTKDGIKITLKQVEKATTNLQKKGLISLNYESLDGLSVKAYSMSKSIFRRDIPIAHYKDIVDTSDEDIKTLIEELEKKKNTSKGRLPDHRDYYTVKVTFQVIDKILGFMPFNEDGKLEHYRQDGNIVLLPTHFRAWIGRNLRLINKSESVKNYFAFSLGHVTLKGKTTYQQFPILDGSQGRGINKFEVIPAGSTIKTMFRVPASDFSKTDFKEFLKLICEMPIRGLSGRAISGYGHLTLLEFV